MPMSKESRPIGDPYYLYNGKKTVQFQYRYDGTVKLNWIEDGVDMGSEVLPRWKAIETEMHMYGQGWSTQKAT